MKTETRPRIEYHSKYGITQIWIDIYVDGEFHTAIQYASGKSLKREDAHAYVKGEIDFEELKTRMGWPK